MLASKAPRRPLGFFSALLAVLFDPRPAPSKRTKVSWNAGFRW
jgi:hypothetical protein